MEANLSGPAGGLKADSYWSALAFHKVPPKYIMGAAFVSYLILAIGYLQGLPAWLAFGLAIAPWVAIVFVELDWVYQHFGWFALFALMAFVQLIHYSEHCIEVVQVHVFGVPTHQALAIFSNLNVEGVHFSGDTFLTVGTLLLLAKFPRNPWLWLAIPFQIFHQAEHTFLFYNYVFMPGHPSGGPGLLASPGGAINGGVGLSRPDLHWIYNTLYTIPFTIALIYQLKRTYDTALQKAFPSASRADLIVASRRLETFRYAPSQTVLAPGDDADLMYIITEGQAAVLQPDASGQEAEIATLGPGQYFGAVGLLIPGAEHLHTIRAKGNLSVLAMDEATFRHLMTASQTSPTEVMQATSGPSSATAPAPVGPVKPRVAG
jgi:hypothetical protein